MISVTVAKWQALSLFYDSAYKLVKKEYVLPIDTNGRCITAKNVCTSDEIPRYSAKEPPMKWECSSECKILSDSDVCTILLTLTSSLLVELGANTSGVGKSNNYYEDIYIPPYNTH